MENLLHVLTFILFQTEYGVVNMLQKSAKELEEQKGENWLDDDFIMGVVMDHTAAGKWVGLQGVIDSLVFYAAFNNSPVISRRFLCKLPVLLVHLS